MPVCDVGRPVRVAGGWVDWGGERERVLERWVRILVVWVEGSSIVLFIDV